MNSFAIIKTILLIIGILFFLWFLIPAIVTFHFHIGALTGMGLSLLLIIYGLWGRQINHLIASGWKSVGGKIIEILLLVICAVIIALAAACTTAMIRGVSGTPEPGSTMIVLGARVYGDRVSLTMQKRLDAAIEFLRDNPDSVCIVSGGQGKNETATEASVMYQYLVDHGIDPSRIYQEDESTDTQENLSYSKKIIEENDLIETVALATDGYHAYRAERYAQQAGLEAETVPAKTVWWLFPTSVIREMYGILEQWILK